MSCGECEYRAALIRCLQAELGVAARDANVEAKILDWVRAGRSGGQRASKTNIRCEYTRVEMGHGRE